MFDKIPYEGWNITLEIPCFHEDLVSSGLENGVLLRSLGGEVWARVSMGYAMCIAPEAGSLVLSDWTDWGLDDFAVRKGSRKRSVLGEKMGIPAIRSDLLY